MLYIYLVSSRLGTEYFNYAQCYGIEWVENYPQFCSISTLNEAETIIFVLKINMWKWIYVLIIANWNSIWTYWLSHRFMIAYVRYACRLFLVEQNTKHFVYCYENETVSHNNSEWMCLSISSLACIYALIISLFLYCSTSLTTANTAMV